MQVCLQGIIKNFCCNMDASYLETEEKGLGLPVT